MSRRARWLKGVRQLSNLKTAQIIRQDYQMCSFKKLIISASRLRTFQK